MTRQSTPEFAHLEELLRSSASAIRYPQTPSVAAGVRARLDEATPSNLDTVVALFRVSAMRIAAASLVVALVTIAAALATPQSREALADFFGLSRVKVEVVPPPEQGLPVLSPNSFAEPSTLVEAREAVDFPILLPALDGVQVLPDEIYLQGPAGAEVVIAVYEELGFDLYQTAASSFGKGVPDGDRLSETEVNGREALWIAGGGHIAMSLDDEGRVLVETERTVQRATLFWEEEGMTYRLETDLPLMEAIQVAESLR